MSSFFSREKSSKPLMTPSARWMASSMSRMTAPASLSFGSSAPRNSTPIWRMARGFFTSWATPAASLPTDSSLADCISLWWASSSSSVRWRTFLARVRFHAKATSMTPVRTPDTLQATRRNVGFFHQIGGSKCIHFLVMACFSSSLMLARALSNNARSIGKSLRTAIEIGKFSSNWCATRKLVMLVLSME